MATKRTTHRSSAGRKLYTVVGKDGKLREIQTYKKAPSRGARKKMDAIAKQFKDTMRELAKK